VKAKTDWSENHQDAIAATFGQFFLTAVVAGAIKGKEIEVGRNLMIAEESKLTEYRKSHHNIAVT